VKASGIIEPGTARLKLRQWKQVDREPFARLNADPGVMEFYPRVLDRRQSDAMADRIESLIAEHGWGFWAVETRDGGEFIGMVGLHSPSKDLPCSPCVEIGWRLARPYWGKGYATEAATAALDTGFTTLGLERIVAFTSVQNRRSRAVMERLGMENTGNDFLHPHIRALSGLQLHCLYRITRDRWQRGNLSHL
jgi:RimJ/RimL family protein N-acetyltransferase